MRIMKKFIYFCHELTNDRNMLCSMIYFDSNILNISLANYFVRCMNHYIANISLYNNDKSKTQ